MGFAHAKHLKKLFWQCQRFTKERKNFTKGLLKRWHTLPLKVDIL
jgi:hypothetical protein